MIQQQQINHYSPIPNHPYAEYWNGYDNSSNYWIVMHCRRCGDTTNKLCSNPARTNYWIRWYGMMHLHQ